jgi:hypothetical protein
MALIDSLIVFIVSLLIGAFGIYIGARVIADYDDYTYAIVTALIGAIAWAIVSWIPLLGLILALILYLAVINWRYPGGWVDAALIALIAWVAVLVVVYILNVIGLASFGALGVPGA